MPGHSLILYDESFHLGQARLDFVENVLEKKADQKYCSPSGLIQDCGCDFESVERTNKDVNRQLEGLIRTDFFRYYKIDLFRECPFWQEDGLCGNRACAVETADESAIPEEYRMGQLSRVSLVQGENITNQEGPFAGCHFRDSDFCILDDEADSDGEWVDLVKNPERFTGYAGESAERVWQSIYQENCFDISTPLLDPGHRSERGGLGFPKLFANTLDLPALLKSLVEPWTGAASSSESEHASLEKRVFYRLISGLHASISIHICDEYLDQTTGLWSPNLECFIARIGSHPERLQNLYFTYVLLLRSLKKASPYLLDYDYSCASSAVARDSAHDQDQLIMSHAPPDPKEQLIQLIQTSQNCPSTFDETAMFTAAGSIHLKGQFKDHFRNISRIMDCVGCDKCKLWGKLQITGLGTALKILFSYGENDLPELSRSEIVAFVWTLSRFSRSLEAVEEFRASYQAQARQQKTPKVANEAHGATKGASKPTKSKSGLPLLFAEAREVAKDLPQDLPYHIASPDNLLENAPDKPDHKETDGHISLRPRRSKASGTAKRRSLAQQVLEKFAGYGSHFDVLGAQTAFVVGGLLVLLASVLATVSLRRKHREGKENILLLGLPGAGKTRLFCQLHLNDVPQTQTSMTPNEGWFSLDQHAGPPDQARPSTDLRLIDLPGHPKLRNAFKRHATATLRASIFLIDAPTAMRNLRPIAEYLYDILSHPSIQAHRTPFLIALSSRASGNDAASPLPSEAQVAKLRTSLESEMTRLRTSRTSTPSTLGSLSTSASTTEEEDPSDQFLGFEGRDFSFDHCENPVLFAACSVGHAKGVQPILTWLGSLA